MQPPVYMHVPEEAPSYCPEHGGKFRKGWQQSLNVINYTPKIKMIKNRDVGC